MGVAYGINPTWAAQTDAGRIHIATKGVVQDGLVLNLDAGASTSYPGSGTSWSDLSGDGNNGTLVNGVGYVGTNGGALTFDGVNDVATIPDDSTWNIGSANTWEMWINMNSVVNNTLPFGKGSMWWFSVGYTLLGGTSGEFNWIANDGSWSTLNTGVTISTSTWYQLVTTWDGTYFRFYVNGNLEATSLDLSAKTWTDSSNSVDIGGFSGGSSYVNAKISIVRIYDQTLSTSEVTQNYNALKGRFQ